MNSEYKSCALCPRRCGIDRTQNKGRCGENAEIRVARAAPHLWEEPCISGKNGSGAVFFSGCPLGCDYCQNAAISRGGAGKPVSPARLAEIFRELENKGVHNINLVTPTHFAPSIIESLKLCRPKIPIVYNCGGYESPDAIKRLKGYVDVYLTDIKYFSDEYAVKYSRAPRYFDYALASLREMLAQTGPPKLEDGLLKSGVIVRHLCLPGLRRDSMRILERLAEFPNGSFLLSLMSQYLPMGSAPELQRRVTSFEYNSVVNRAVELGLTDGYTQERSSARNDYIPEFNGEGV